MIVYSHGSSNVFFTQKESILWISEPNLCLQHFNRRYIKLQDSIRGPIYVVVCTIGKFNGVDFYFAVLWLDKTRSPNAFCSKGCRWDLCLVADETFCFPDRTRFPWDRERKQNEKWTVYSSWLDHKVSCKKLSLMRSSVTISICSLFSRREKYDLRYYIENNLCL